MDISLYLKVFQQIVFSEAFFLVAFGVVLGVIFGAIPGLTAALAVVILLPFTYGLDTMTGLAMLIAAYIGGISGGLVSSILIGMPGTPSSVTTVFDGFPMTKKGLGGKALGAGVMANVVGSLMGLLALVLFSPQLAKIALRFSSFEYTLLILFAFLTVVGVSEGEIFKGIVMSILGLVLGTMGLDQVTGDIRATFGISFLRGGISSLPAMLGLLVLAKVFEEIESDIHTPIVPKLVVRMRDIHPSLQEMKQSSGNYLRSGIIGVFIGILPGIGGAVANFVAYDQAKKANKNPESFGHGNVQGVIASETANNAVIGGALIPLLVFGIPGDAVTAMLLGGLQLKGVRPGPLIFQNQPELIVGIFISFFLAVILMYVFMMWIGIWFFQKMLSIKKKYLLPLVLLMSVAGSYNIAFRVADIWIIIIFGIIGYVLNKNEFPVIPLVISLLLGPMFETNLRTSMMFSAGKITPFFTRPMSLVIWLLIGVTLFFIVKKNRKI